MGLTELVSNRSRGNSSVGNKLNNLDSRVSSREKKAASNIRDNAVSSSQLATNSVGSDALSENAVEDTSVARGAVSEEHFSTISRVRSDYNLQLETGAGGSVYLVGDQYPVPANGSAPLLINSENKVILGTDSAAVIAALQGLVASPGDVKMVAGSTPATGWLLCNGSAVSRSTYANLFSTIGTSYGSGDGSTTFNLPNLQGKIPVGQQSGDSNFGTVGATGGEKAHVLTQNELASHSHGQDAHNHGVNDPGHGHGVTDNQHAHNVYDGGHSHGVNDPSHGHGSTTGSGFQTYVNGNGARRQLATSTNSNVYAISSSPGNTYVDYGSAANNYTGISIQGSGANIGIYNSYSNISINGSGTGISTQNAQPGIQSTGGNVAHNNLQPYVVMNYVIRY